MGTFIKLYDTNKEQRDKIWSFFKFKDEDSVVYINTRAGKRKIQNDFHPFNRKTCVIGSGFYDYLLAFMSKNGWDYEVSDYREFSRSPDEEEIDAIDWERVIKDPGDQSKWIVFHEYQKNIIRTCMRKRYGVVSSPTASGKTVTFGGLIKLMNVPTLVVFDEIQLAHQTYDEFIKFGFDKKDLGIVQGSNVLIKPITFSTIQSRSKLYDCIDAFKMVVFDECHAVKAQSFNELLINFKSNIRFGFSGTPWDINNPAHAAKVIQYVGPLIYDEKDTRELIDEGYLAKDRFIFVKCDRAKEGNVVWTKSGKDYHELYRKEIVDNKYRNLLITILCMKHKDEKIVVLYESVTHNHGEKIAELCREHMPDRDIKVLEGKNSVKERKDAIEFFENTKNGIIIASRIFNKGVNIKTVSVGINASAGKAFIQSVQKAGRLLRKGKGKDEMIYYDFVDENSNVFLKQSKRRMKTYKDRGHKIEIYNPKEKNK